MSIKMEADENPKIGAWIERCQTIYDTLGRALAISYNIVNPPSLDAADNECRKEAPCLAEKLDGILNSLEFRVETILTQLDTICSKF